FISLLACSPAAQDQSEATKSAMPEKEAVVQPEETSVDTDQASESAPELAVFDQTQTNTAAMKSISSGVGQKIEMTAALLGSLCTNKYGCIEEVIRPLGWSNDGKFAYLIEGAYEAVNNYKLQLFIQDMETDKIVAEQSWEASKQAGWTEEQDVDFQKVWATERSNFVGLIAEHQIQEGLGVELLSLPYSFKGRRYQFKNGDVKIQSDYTGSEIVSKHELVTIADGLGKKRIANVKFGKYDLVQATHVLGIFKSPFEDRVAVLDAAEYRGYEGPPNVLKFKLVGCLLEEGF
ncbi:MAG: hypothetical protein AAGJ93_16195, partial [Bacteroidota bacterium]